MNEIEQEAWKRYPDVHKGTKGMADANHRHYFTEGAVWMKRNIIDKVQWFLMDNCMGIPFSSEDLAKLMQEIE